MEYVFLYHDSDEIVFEGESSEYTNDGFPVPVLRVVPLETDEFVVDILEHDAGLLKVSVFNRITGDRRQLACSDNLASYAQLAWKISPGSCEGEDLEWGSNDP